jgi:hypothetical protein
VASALGVALNDCIASEAGPHSKHHVASPFATVGRDIAPCPYRGLLAFREMDTDVFFGRELLIELLKDKLEQKCVPKLRAVLDQGQLSYLLQQVLAASGSRGLLLFIDQFEERTASFHIGGLQMQFRMPT